MLHVIPFRSFCSLTLRVEGSTQAQVKGFVDAGCQSVNKPLIGVAGHGNVDVGEDSVKVKTSFLAGRS